MKTQININSITNNFLDKGFQKTLLPYRCIQHMLFISRFSIKYNCIRPHRVSYYIVSFIGTFGFIFFHSGNILAGFDGKINQFLSVFVNLNVVLIVIPFILFFTLNVIQRKDHVQMILEIQRAFRLINYKHYKKSVKRNWFGIVRHFIIYAIFTSVTYDLKLAVHFYTLIYFDVNISYGISVIALIKDGIISWVSDIEYYSNISLELEDNKYDDKLEKLFQAYTHLMEAFAVFKKIFKFATLFQVLHTFFLSILYLQTSVELAKSGATHFGTFDNDTFTLITIIWGLKNVSFINIFCTNCEKFYESVYEADSACCRLLKNLQTTVRAKRLCKNVRRVSRVEFQKMTACRIFTIDGRLPQDFSHLILEYLCLTLQFALVQLIKLNFEH